MPDAMPVRFERVTKRFGAHTILSDVDLEVGAGECVVLLGPSGCGKTTLLRMLAGLETPDAGRIVVGDRVVNDVPAAERDVAMVFQNYALYPHLSVFDNIAFPLVTRRVARDEADRRVRGVAERLGLTPCLTRRPSQLSGGQQQRVALARAIVRNPSVYLMDEPLSNLDAQLRVQTRAELKRIQQDLRTTTIYVTHDQAEAMTLGQRVAILKGGRVEQFGPPLDLYRFPANTFVARFLGSPAINLWNASVDAEGRVGAVGLTLCPKLPGRFNPQAFQVGVRPEDVEIAVTPSEGWSQAQVDVVEPIGNETIVSARVAGMEVVARAAADTPLSSGDSVWFRVAPERVLFFDTASGHRLA
ncbi:MAG TPA: ABC transporter ATP-binding protein [Vicinamibacterales bacterium]|jgi:multiple sugar transport system ATP-binding protein|nr:ABC transporter ATP-binding protein [Vicinamibacterales bacterium]